MAQAGLSRPLIPWCGGLAKDSQAIDLMLSTLANDPGMWEPTEPHV